MEKMAGFVNFKPDEDIPSLNGKVLFVTGGTAGLGRLTVQKLARHNPRHIYFSGRNRKGGEALIAEMSGNEASPVSLTFVEMDLASLTSVKAASQYIHHDRLDVLICNAGIMSKPPALSQDGYEIQFATNHLGHAMLIRQVLPLMLKTAAMPGADVRIVSLSSDGWTYHPKGGIKFSELDTTQGSFFGASLRYGQSKLANLVYAAELARRYPDITSVSIHPGVINTDLVSTLPARHKFLIHGLSKLNVIEMMTEEKGVLNSLWMAVGMNKKDIVNGGFYRPVGVLCNHKLNKVAKDENFAKELWEWTENALKDF